MNKLLATVVTAIGFILPLVLSATGRDGDHYAKVEIKGIIQTNMAAIGGETTGTVIKVGDLSLDLDLGENRTLQALAERLNGKTVLIKGTLMRIKGIERGERDVVVVESLSAFD
jgi:calcineurin-like phosphoesterase family protein